MTTTPVVDRPPLEVVDPPTCAWFALCDRPATHTRRHPHPRRHPHLRRLRGAPVVTAPTYITDGIRIAIADAITRHPFAPAGDVAIDVTIAPAPTPQGIIMLGYVLMAAPSPIIGQRTLNVVGVPLEALMGNVDQLVDELVGRANAAASQLLATTPEAPR